MNEEWKVVAVYDNLPLGDLYLVEQLVGTKLYRYRGSVVYKDGSLRLQCTTSPMFIVNHYKKEVVQAQDECLQGNNKFVSKQWAEEYRRLPNDAIRDFLKNKVGKPLGVLLRDPLRVPLRAA